MNLKTIYEIYKKEIDINLLKHDERKRGKNERTIQRIQSIIDDAQMSKIQSHYPTDYAASPTSLSTMDEDEDTIQESQALQPVEMKPIESNLNEVMLDNNRIVHSNAGLSGLYEFVPATKIKGN